MKKLDKIALLLEGIGSIIFLYPQKNSRKVTLPRSSICGSLENDWKKIGIDMWHSFRSIESQQIEVNQYRDNNDRQERCPTQRP